MTMFSMKPKFNLVEFLAVPAPKGPARSGGARRRATEFRRDSTPEDEVKPTVAEDTNPAEEP